MTPNAEVSECEVNITLPKRTYRWLDRIDAMPPGLRQCVHEFGPEIVNACLEAGVSEPRNIRHLVLEIWSGARTPLNRSGIRGRSPIIDALDWTLIQAGSNVSAMTLLRFLYSRTMVIVPLEPSTVSVTASMETVSGFDMRCTKYQKHFLRLKAATAASAKQLWPHLFDGAN